MNRPVELRSEKSLNNVGQNKSFKKKKKRKKK